MDNTTDPGDIPEWQQAIIDMTPKQRRETAMHLGLSPQAIENWKNGDATPHPKNLERLERRLKAKRGWASWLSAPSSRG